jgi:hypothetical protein
MAGIFGIGAGSAGGSSALDDVLLSWKAHAGWIGDIQVACVRSCWLLAAACLLLPACCFPLFVTQCHTGYRY